MSYQLASTSPELVVLKRDEHAGTNAVILIIGIVLTPIGAKLLFASIGADSDFSFLGLVLTLFGVMFLLAGTVVLPAQRRRIPVRLIFNNHEGVMEVHMDKRSRVGYVPYSEIEGFSSRTITTRATEGSGANTTYYVWLKKKDGADWDLLSSSSHKTALTLLNTLRSSVDLSKVANPALVSKFSEKINTTASNDKVLIHWRGTFPIAFLLVSVFSLLIVAFTVKAVSGLGENFIQALPFMAASAGLSYLVYWMIRAARRDYCITIDQHELCYFEFSKRSGQQKKLEAIPLSDIGRVVYTFSPYLRGASQVRVLTHSNVAYMQEVAGDAVRSFYDMFNGKKQPLSLTLEGLDPVDCLAAEKWIEQKINRSKTEGIVQ